MQKENNISASLTVPVTIRLRHQMHQISSSFNNKMVSTFKRSIKERLSRYEEEESYVVAAVLDPSLGGVKVKKLTMLNHLCTKTFKQFQYKMMKF